MGMMWGNAIEVLTMQLLPVVLVLVKQHTKAHHTHKNMLPLLIQHLWYCFLLDETTRAWNMEQHGWFRTTPEVLFCVSLISHSWEYKVGVGKMIAWSVTSLMIAPRHFLCYFASKYACLYAVIFLMNVWKLHCPIGNKFHLEVNLRCILSSLAYTYLTIDRAMYERAMYLQQYPRVVILGTILECYGAWPGTSSTVRPAVVYVCTNSDQLWGTSNKYPLEAGCQDDVLDKRGFQKLYTLQQNKFEYPNRPFERSCWLYQDIFQAKSYHMNQQVSQNFESGNLDPNSRSWLGLTCGDLHS